MNHCLAERPLLLLPLRDALESLAPLNVSLRLARVERIHVFLVVKPFLTGKVAFEGDCAQGSPGRVRAVQQRLRIIEQVWEKVIWLPFAVSARDVHRGSSYLDCLTAAVLLGSDQAAVLLRHVLLHLIVVRVELLAGHPVDVAQILRAHQVELCSALTGSVWLDERRFVPVVDILNVLIDGSHALLQLSLLVQRWQEGDLLAHLGELERFGHALFSLQLFALQLIICLHLEVLLPQVLIVADHALELLAGVSRALTDLIKAVIVVRASDFLPHWTSSSYSFFLF